MIDCPNAEIRDRLPDLLHERLDASTRAAVVAHLEQCADCRAELTVLREARVVLTSGVRIVDVTAIARVVVARTATPAIRAPRRNIWIDWRIAASIALVAVGGASFAAIRASQHHDAPAQRQQVGALPNVLVRPRVASESARPSARITTPRPMPAPSAELSAGGGVSDLSDNDLRALLDDLQTIDAVPPTEPEPVTVRVSPSGPGSVE